MKRVKKPKMMKVYGDKIPALLIAFLLSTTGAFALSVGSLGGGVGSAISAATGVFTGLITGADLTLGDSASSATLITMDKDENGAAMVSLQNEGTQRGYINFDSSESISIFTQTGVPVVFGTNNSEAMRIASGGNVALFAAGASNQTPAHFTVGGSNASFGIDASTAAGSTSAVLGSTSPATNTAPYAWVSGQICNSVGVSCVTIYFPVWR